MKITFDLKKIKNVRGVHLFILFWLINKHSINVYAHVLWRVQTQDHQISSEALYRMNTYEHAIVMIQ